MTRFNRRARALASVLAVTLALAVALTPAAALGCYAGLDAAGLTAGDSAKLVFVHHSTGAGWLADDGGALGIALRDAGYFVSDTNYGWGPDAIGDRTDIGDWWTWFRGADAATYTAALYAESGQNASYSRLASDPGGENAIVMLKSCFPNSAVGGSPADPIPAIGDNPLAGAGMSGLTVGNAKGVYRDWLVYTAAHPEKLFVLVVSPPLLARDTTRVQASNARALANWLVSPTGLLQGYAGNNVVVFDLFTVLTGGTHTVVNGTPVHTVGASDYLLYPASPTDSHPSAAGAKRATAQFVPLLNAAYHAWKGDARPQVSLTRPAPSVSSPRHGVVFRVRGSIGPAHTATSSVQVRIERKVRGVWRYLRTASATVPPGATTYSVKVSLRYAGAYRMRAVHACPDHVIADTPWRYVTVR